MYTYLHTYIHTYIRTYTHTYIHIHTYIHTYIDTYINTYILNTYIYGHIYMYVNILKCTFIYVLLYVQHGAICLLCIYCHNNCPYKAYHDVFSLRWWRFSNPKLTHDKHLCLVLLTNLSRCYDLLTLRLYKYYTLCIEDIRIRILYLWMNVLICRKKKSSRVFLDLAIVICVLHFDCYKLKHSNNNQRTVAYVRSLLNPSNGLKRGLSRK